MLDGCTDIQVGEVDQQVPGDLELPADQDIDFSMDEVRVEPNNRILAMSCFTKVKISIPPPPTME